MSLLNLSRRMSSFTKKCMTSNVSFKNMYSMKQDSIVEQNQQWKTVFKFPFIKQAAAVNKLKIYQAAFTVLVVPLSYMAESFNVLPEASFLVALTIGISGTLTLSLFSGLTSNVIGFIYINDLKDLVKISYMDFLGRRKNVELSLSEIIPLSEFKQQSRWDFYAKVRLYTGKKEYKIVHKYGGIKDYSDFKLIFGDTS